MLVAIVHRTAAWSWLGIVLACSPALHAATAPGARSDAYEGAQFELDPATRARGTEIHERVCASRHDDAKHGFVKVGIAYFELGDARHKNHVPVGPRA